MSSQTHVRARTAVAAREREHFDRLAQEARESWWGHRTPAGLARLGRRAERLSDHLAAYSDPRVLEIGCGTGTFTAALLERRPALSLFACDISPRSIELARRRCRAFARARFEIADVLDGGWQPGSFDAVVGNSILHHLSVEAFLPCAWHALGPGGLIWFSEPNLLNPQVAAERYIRALSRRLDVSPDETAFLRWRLREQLRRADFERVTVRPFDFLHPLTPRPWMSVMHRIERNLERLPVLREIAGSLEVVAFKPDPTHESPPESG